MKSKRNRDGCGKCLFEASCPGCYNGDGPAIVNRIVISDPGNETATIYLTTECCGQSIVTDNGYVFPVRSC